MKNINEFSNTGIANIQRFEQSPQAYHETIKAELSECATVEINKVFEQLKTIFPAWPQAFPTQSSLNLAKNVWSKALIEAGVTSKEQLAIGFMKARRSQQDFMPSCGKFIAWCKPEPEDFGLPCMEQAYQMVIHHRITPDVHSAVKIAARKTKYERSTLKADEYKKVFSYTYQRLFELVMRGESIEIEIPKAIENKATHSQEYYQERGKVGAAKLKELFKYKSKE